MAEVTLAEHLAEERSVAIRTLLAAPLLDVNADPTGFRLVARHQPWLVEWFESSCGCRRRRRLRPPGQARRRP